MMQIPRSSPGDKVYIPPADIIATVAGNTPYPGTYELVQGETLKDLLLLAGNIRPDTMTQDIEIVRFQARWRADPDYPAPLDGGPV